MRRRLYQNDRGCCRSHFVSFLGSHSQAKPRKKRHLAALFSTTTQFNRLLQEFCNNHDRLTEPIVTCRC